MNNSLSFRICADFSQARFRTFFSTQDKSAVWDYIEETDL
jgi:hypothetical protein